MPEESTTPDLAELARRLREAFDRGEFVLALTFYAPDAVLDTSPMGLEELRGHAAIRQGWVDALSAYAAFNLSEEGRTDLGNGVVLTVLVVKGLLSDSGGDLNMRYAQVNEWRDGLIARETLYTDLDEARAAAKRLAESRGQA
jgi:ketosteroid isomerase-like protein